MLLQLKQQNVDLWEAWIDLQTAANDVATLYVIGDVYTDDRFAQPYFIKREHPFPDVLALEILPGITSDDGYVTEIMYTEELNNAAQYSSILIYVGNDLVTRIEDIEKIS